MTTLTSADAFTGLGGFTLGFERVGISTTVMIEKDPYCQLVLKHHWPDIPLKGDISGVVPADLGRPSILAGGFPCQDTSIAAPDRAGLAGKRSGNFWGFYAVLYDFLRLIDSTLPRWVVIENPVGLLTSPGKSKTAPRGDGVDRTGWDMAAVVRALEDLGYGWAYRVVDGRRFGSPQKRERVILVGHLGGDARPAGQVLGLVGAGDGPTGPSDGPAGEDRPASDPSVVRLGGELVYVFRKSSRARASLAAGGWENWVPAEYANTLTCNDAGLANRQTHLLVQGGQLRTLTLTEWERLQCLPDGHTAVAGVTDSARGDMLGNAMHVGMAEWLGRQIVAVDAALPLITPRPALELA